MKTKEYRHIEYTDDNDFVIANVATEGDWIIKGVQGEFYPIKPDIFEETYELVE